MKCDDCKFECGEWECSNYDEFYIYECEKGLTCYYDDEECEGFESLEIKE